MYPTQREPFRKWLAEERDRLGVGVVVLASWSGLTVSRVREIESGKRPSNPGHRAQLVQALIDIEKEQALA
jgi:predicted transcriptional regulator